MWENRREQVAMARSTARPSTAAPLRATLDDRRLARLAIDGDGEAFAQLYDRHERRVYGYCLRMLGTPDEAADATQETFMRLLRRLPAMEGREVNFVAYALTTARNACYDGIEARSRVRPAAEPIDQATTEPGAPIGRDAGELGEIALDPERAALLAAAREDVRAANGRLPERQREALALRELEQLSYEQIGEVIGLNENAVAQLISRARIRLREELRGEALQSIATSSPECERALALMARLQDAQDCTPEEHDWLRVHMDSCDTCPLSRAVMEEAGISYRALGPIVPLAWLRHTTIARAARFVGADWSHLTGTGSAHGTTPGTMPSPPTTPPAGGQTSIDSHVTATDYERMSGRTAVARRRIRPLSAASARGTTGRRLRQTLLATILCTVLVVVLAGGLAPDSRVLPQQVTSVSSAARTTYVGVGDHRTIKLTHGAKASIHARPAPRESALASLTSTSGARGDQPSVSTPTVHQTARRYASKRRSTHHATHHTSPPSPAPAGTPSSPPPTATTPSTTTPTSTAPAPNPPVGSGGGTQTTTTPTGTPGGGPSGSTEGEHSCTLAVACP
jgi:RNA polymerase sigma-70 factor (ECF subfamily)